MKNAIIYLVVFLAIQIGAGMIVNASWMLISGESASDSAMGLIVTTVLSSVITIAVFLMAKWSEVSRHWIRKRPWITMAWCAVAAFGAIIPSLWFQEHMPELPNIAEETFDMIMKDRLGYLSIGLLAPFWLRWQKSWYSEEPSCGHSCNGQTAHGSPSPSLPFSSLLLT